MKTILTCTDGSSYAPSLYEHTAWAAKRAGASVQVLHLLEQEEALRGQNLAGSLGFDAGTDLLEELVRVDEAHNRVARLRGQAILKDAEKQLRASGVAEVSSIQRHGVLVDSIPEFEKEAELLVLGKRGEHADFAKGHLGSNLERVVRIAKEPVMVASRVFEPISSFLIAFDGGESSLKAVHFAASHPLLKGLECHLLAVGKGHSELERELHSAELALQGADFTVSAQLVEGDADEVIAKKVEEDKIGLLAMGAYGHSKIRRMLIGSTTTALVRDCHVPVLLFR